MQISCPNCQKTFNLEDNLIPIKGRLLQCGSCQNKWFYKKNEINNNSENNSNLQIKKSEVKKIKVLESFKNKTNNFKEEKITSPTTNKIEKKTKIKKTNLFKLFFSLVISFIALILLIDTFKLQIAKIFPQIESILYNLYETLKDIYLFFKDFVK
tara:strand:+ start:664 stop:1128 length:465 start_codon:yes stop_codon:yes gene_type:complete